MIKSNKKLDGFFDLLTASCETFDKNLFNFYKNTNLFYKIETPIILELMGKNFKKKRQRSHEGDPKKEEKEEEKEREEETEKRKRRSADEINISSGIDFTFFQKKWNDVMCPPFAPCQMLTTKRQTNIRNLLKNYPDFNIDDYLNRIINSEFLRGDKTGWKADFQWCFTHGNYLKVMEGKYDTHQIKSKAELKQEKMLNILKEYENADRTSTN